MRIGWDYFEGCWERARRAEFHRSTGAETWNRLINEDVYHPLFKVNPDGTGRIWIEQTHPLPTELALEFGEALYQFRAALDGLVYAAAVMESQCDPPPNENFLEFPICDSESSFLGNATQRKIAPLPQKLRDLIKSVQPYDTPHLLPNEIPFNFNRALGILNDWARKDRHRRLHLVWSWASNAQPRFRLPEGVTVAEFSIRGAGFLENESEIATFALDGWSPGMKIQMNPDVMIDIAVNETPPPISDNDTFGLRLKAIGKAIAVLIVTFEDHFRKRHDAPPC